MLVSTIAPSEKPFGLELGDSTIVHYQSTPEELEQDTLRLREGVLSSSGALVINTGEFTGRSPKDRFIVEDEITKGLVNWNELNIALSKSSFDKIFAGIQEYFRRVPELWVRDCQACADKRFNMDIRLVAEKPWSALFAHNMFIRPDKNTVHHFQPDWTIYVAPGLKLNPREHGLRSTHASVINFQQRTIIIVGTGYTGEIKKSIFSVLNLLLPQFRSVLGMHCSANMGEAGDTALFFGLSGTGKTTLSADPERRLIGDDEHGWTRDNIFNFEGGCYAKVINLRADLEPQIFGAIKKGALLENTVFLPGTNEVDFSCPSITENTRVSYPLEHIPNAVLPSHGAVPSHIFFLTCDAYGVLPPISRLTPAQAMYQFISGYTAKIAGTEAGITEPVSTFSACFGAPFMPLHPGRYASLLGDRIRQHNVQVWLINTGWTGGPYGTGSRISLNYTRRIIRAVLNGEMKKASMVDDPVFGLQFPMECSGVPSSLLCPRDTWTDKYAYDNARRQLANRFILNFERYADGVEDEIRRAGPSLNAS